MKFINNVKLKWKAKNDDTKVGNRKRKMTKRRLWMPVTITDFLGT